MQVFYLRLLALECEQQIYSVKLDAVFADSSTLVNLNIEIETF